MVNPFGFPIPKVGNKVTQKLSPTLIKANNERFSSSSNRGMMGFVAFWGETQPNPT
jgi:hypothetical protein